MTASSSSHINENPVSYSHKSVVQTDPPINRQHAAILDRAKRKTLRMTFSIIVAFLMCWTPFVFVCVWTFVHPESVHQKVPKWLLEWFELFTVTNSVANPLVYGLHSLNPTISIYEWFGNVCCRHTHRSNVELSMSTVVNNANGGNNSSIVTQV